MEPSVFAACTLGRLSLCVFHDAATVLSLTAASNNWAKEFYCAAARHYPVNVALGLFFVVGCFGSLAGRWRQPRARIMLALLSCVLLPLSCVLGSSALQYLYMGGDGLPSNEVLVSFAHSHFVEALAAISIIFFASTPKERARISPKKLRTLVVVTWNVWFGTFERRRRWDAIIKQAARD